MADPEKKICRYFNTLGGCWYGDNCKFLHIPNKKPPCKFYGSSAGCRYGEGCHFSHDRTPFKSVENYNNNPPAELIKEVLKENMNPNELSGTNNNNITQSILTNSEHQKIENTYKTINDQSIQIVSTIIDNNTNKLNVTSTIGSSCKHGLERRDNESYCTLLKDHYLECFLDKEGDHVKYVKTKAALDPGQMYWCKSCILIFEKPWSLFQHMADKAKGSKVQRWEKKIHLDWMDNVAGLMAGYDLGLFSPAKLKVDLRNLLADQHTMEEEMEAVAMTAAAMMQWLAPLSSPWRLQQREMMRKIEQLNRQMLRKANLGLNAGLRSYNVRAALPPAPISTHASSCHIHSPNSKTVISLPSTPVSKLTESQSSTFSNNGLKMDNCDRHSPAKFVSSCIDHNSVLAESETNHNVEKDDISEPSNDIVGPVGDGEYTWPESTVSDQEEVEFSTKTGASGDIPRRTLSNGVKFTSEVEEESDTIFKVVDSNNTNSSCSVHMSNKYNDNIRRKEVKRPLIYSSSTGALSGKISNYSGILNPKYLDEPLRYHGRNNRSLSFGHNHLFGAYRNTHHVINRGRTGMSGISSHRTNTFNPPSFHASLDMNFGFTNDEVEELLSRGIKPWDSEASATLAVLRGELDHHLLD
ncbi:unnamed protein product [Heterobilharzia americana]|nr:unnamed protein product [Heterobilharzia americana]